MVQNNRNTHQIGVRVFRLILNFGCNVLPQFCRNRAAVNLLKAQSLEFRSEGIVTGTCVKLFSIAGPVLVFGISASAIYGLIYWLSTSVF